MTRLQSIALYAIALLLISNFAIAHIRPIVVLALGEAAYLSAAQKCHESLASWEQSQVIASQIDKDTALALERSASVALMECYDKVHLRHDLLAQGVNVHELNRIDMRARNDADVGLRYFVRGVASER